MGSRLGAVSIIDWSVMMYTIRQYESKDRKRVEAICLSPDTNGENTKNNILSKALLTVFCRYYTEREPQNCFVAVDEQDEVIGYILCAENFQSWEESFTRLYLNKTINPIAKAMGKGTIDGMRPFSAEYPAHLHIDLSKKCQRQGIGTKLMDTLLEHLQKQGIPGVMLAVASDNEKGLNFYRKYGFQELERKKREILMGKKWTTD